ncbi:MAG: hypothetical protein ACE5LU_05765 [Anaerolineae bacterium]
MLLYLRWSFIGAILTLAALTVAACGSGDAPAATPPVSFDQPMEIGRY